ncbi:Putative ribonuclease H protein At1g65750 [Linum perenne]
MTASRLNTRIWHFSRNGEYTVRSAYRLLRDRVVPSTHLHRDGEWRKLWSYCVPPKMKHMLWRAIRGVLPTKEGLQHKGIDIDWRCGICDGNPETPWNLFLDCDFARDCWQETGLGTLIAGQRDRAESFEEWAHLMLKEGTDQTIQTISAVIWAIWRERNARVWSQCSQPAARVVVQESDVVRSTLKCNTDAATFARLGLIGVGACLRNNHGQLLGFRMSTKRAGLSIAECEALALLEAMGWAQQQGLQDVNFESDAKTIVDSLKNADSNYTELRDLLKKCKLMLTACPNFSVTHITRDSNSAAHTLARFSCNYDAPTVGVLASVWLQNSLNNLCLSTH